MLIKNMRLNHPVQSLTVYKEQDSSGTKYVIAGLQKDKLGEFILPHSSPILSGLAGMMVSDGIDMLTYQAPFQTIPSAQAFVGLRIDHLPLDISELGELRRRYEMCVQTVLTRDELERMGGNVAKSTVMRDKIPA